MAVKQEEAGVPPLSQPPEHADLPKPTDFIDLSSSDSDDDAGDCTGKKFGSFSEGKRSGVMDACGGLGKKLKAEDFDVVLPLTLVEALPLPEAGGGSPVAVRSCKQFWKAGDYEGDSLSNLFEDALSAGMDHVRVHPKFLHSNATSHKWALGAFAELLDNSLDEVCNGGTYVSIDVIENDKDKRKMLLIQDNGGGMDPDGMRKCMSLGYSAKSKIANTIGQYGNGFKTSTMRLGADVIVFSRSHGKKGKSSTQSIGMLSYTFLRSTQKEDIVVPMVDYEAEGNAWKKVIRSSLVDWERSFETILQWSPFTSEEHLLQQFSRMTDQGTCIVIYNLWEEDLGESELDFNADPHDIQIRGVNRDEKKIQMAEQFPNSKHFLTYCHSLRSYASILYLRLPLGFKIILRGREVQHHNLIDDMMLIQEVSYRTKPGVDGVFKDLDGVTADVTIGFVKDAKHHIDIQGFNVYHKNRLIKPFWRVWTAAGSGGRGIIGVLEANFIEPAHDKQDFERTIVLQRLESRLVQMQKTYWSNYSHMVGYVPPNQKNTVSTVSLNALQAPSHHSRNGSVSLESETANRPSEMVKSSSLNRHALDRRSVDKRSYQKVSDALCNENELSGTFSEENALNHLKAENRKLQKRLMRMGDSVLLDMQIEKEKGISLEAQIHELEQKLEEANKEQEALIDIFSEERNQRDKGMGILRKKLKDASATIQELLERVRYGSQNR